MFLAPHVWILTLVNYPVSSKPPFQIKAESVNSLNLMQENLAYESVNDLKNILTPHLKDGLLGFELILLDALEIHRMTLAPV